MSAKNVLYQHGLACRLFRNIDGLHKRGEINMALVPAKLLSQVNTIDGLISASDPASLTLNFSNGYRGIIVGIGAGTANCFALIVRVQSNANPSICPIYLGSNITYSNTTNKITITKTGSSSISVYDITFEGSVSA